MLGSIGCIAFWMAVVGGIGSLVNRSYEDYGNKAIRLRMTCVKDMKVDFVNAMGWKEETWLAHQKRLGQDWTGLTPEQAELRAWRSCFMHHGGWEVRHIVPPPADRGSTPRQSSTETYLDGG